MAREKRILVIEDDDAIRALLFTVLRRRGFKVDVASNGASGLDRLTRCVYSLILLDLMMPVMSGYEFLAELEKRTLSHRPLIIVLTAGAAPRNLPSDMVAGTVRKPFDIELLLDTVVACLSTQQDAPQNDTCAAADSDRSDSIGPRDEPN
jgi:DNA-binding response OmpR family regulator